MFEPFGSDPELRWPLMTNNSIFISLCLHEVSWLVCLDPAGALAWPGTSAGWAVQAQLQNKISNYQPLHVESLI